MINADVLENRLYDAEQRVMHNPMSLDARCHLEEELRGICAVLRESGGRTATRLFETEVALINAQEHIERLEWLVEVSDATSSRVWLTIIWARIETIGTFEQKRARHLDAHSCLDELLKYARAAIAKGRGESC